MIKKYTKFKAGTKKLWTMGAYAAGAYGIEGGGASLTRRKQLVASAALASGVTGHGLNPTLVMKVVLGKDDVEIKTQVATVFAWLEIWCTPFSAGGAGRAHMETQAQAAAADPGPAAVVTGPEYHVGHHSHPA